MAPCMCHTCRAACKHLAMTVLLLLVTRCLDKRCRHRTLAGKQVSCATEHWLMSDGVADNERVDFDVILSQAKEQSTGYIHLY